MGDVVNQASKLCNYGNKTNNDAKIMINSWMFSNLNEHNQKLLRWNENRQCYHGDIIMSNIENWIKLKLIISFTFKNLFYMKKSTFMLFKFWNIPISFII